MIVQSPTQKLSAATPPGTAVCSVVMKAGGVLSAGGGGSGGPVGGAALGTCASAPPAGGFGGAGFDVGGLRRRWLGARRTRRRGRRAGAWRIRARHLSLQRFRGRLTRWLVSRCSRGGLWRLAIVYTHSSAPFCHA